jgi:hypothetical protein
MSHLSGGPYWPQQQPPTPPKRYKGAAITLGVLLGLSLLGNVGLGAAVLNQPDPAPASQVIPDSVEPKVGTIEATLDLVDQDTADSNCEGQDGYDDIDDGASATITDERDVIIGSTVMVAGSPDGDTCTYTMVFDDVLLDRAQYALNIGTRNGFVVSRSKLATDGWKIAVEIS